MILSRGIQYKQISEEIKSKAKLDSKIKSVSRFLSGNYIDKDQYYQFISSYLPEDKMILSIDRTTCEMGKEVRNLLVLGVSYQGISIPVIFKAIEYKGNCTANDQLELINIFQEKFGKEKIKAIVGDREFDSEKLINYLSENGIPYVLRIRKTNRIEVEKGKKIKIMNLNKKRIKNMVTKFYSKEVKFNNRVLKSGEYLSLVSSVDIEDALSVYKRRWDIEMAFKACKSKVLKLKKAT